MMELMESKNVIRIIQETLNLVDSRLLDHGERVGYIVSQILKESGEYSHSSISDICILSLFHDIGAYKTDEIDKMIQFETTNIWKHSIYGYLFLKYMTPLYDLAVGVLFHHYDYCKLMKLDFSHIDVAAILNLADRIDIYMQSSKKPIEEEFFERYRNKKFSSQHIDWFLKANKNHRIENKIRTKEYKKDLYDAIDYLCFSQEEIEQYLYMLVYAIDFRSEFTVVHTMNTVSISIEIAKACNIKEERLNKLKYGALLHDLGKIAIPVEILEFPGKLSSQAMTIMKTHVNITRDIIQEYVDNDVCEIAVRHHEKIDGSGYPLGLTGDVLTQEQKIVAIADIVSALSGTRSYKNSFSKEKIIRILTEMKEDRKLAPEIVDVMINNYDKIMGNAERNCKEVLDMYLSINKEYQEIYKKCSTF